jgi:hypothetical protein
VKQRQPNTEQWPITTEPTWTFVRGVDELTISRRVCADGVILALSLNESAPHTYAFPNLAAARRRQTEIEGSLIRFGWSFVGYLPQRRSRDERRGAPRPADDRRRWWTDGYIFGLDL